MSTNTTNTSDLVDNEDAFSPKKTEIWMLDLNEHRAELVCRQILGEEETTEALRRGVRYASLCRDGDYGVIANGFDTAAQFRYEAARAASAATELGLVPEVHVISRVTEKVRAAVATAPPSTVTRTSRTTWSQAALRWARRVISYRKEQA